MTNQPYTKKMNLFTPDGQLLVGTFDKSTLKVNTQEIKDLECYTQALEEDKKISNEHLQLQINFCGLDS